MSQSVCFYDVLYLAALDRYRGIFNLRYPSPEHDTLVERGDA